MLIILYITGVIAMAVPNLYRARLHYREWQGIRSFHTFLTDNPAHIYSTWHSRDELWCAGVRAKEDMKESLGWSLASLVWPACASAKFVIASLQRMQAINNEMAPPSQIDHAKIREEEGF